MSHPFVRKRGFHSTGRPSKSGRMDTKLRSLTVATAEFAANPEKGAAVWSPRWRLRRNSLISVLRRLGRSLFFHNRN